MKIYFFSLSILLLAVTDFTYGQPKISKPIIDSAAITDWADLLWSEPIISNNGKYFMYPINNVPHGSQTLVVQETEGSWKREFVGVGKGIFSTDSKLVLFQSKDSLCMLRLGSDKMDIVSGISTFKVPVNDFTQKPTEVKKVVYLLKNKRLLILRDLLTSKELFFENVSEYKFNEKGSILLVKKLPGSGDNSQSIELVSTGDGESKLIWSTEWFHNTKLSASSFTFDKKGKQLVFLVEEKANENEIKNSIWYYKEGMDKAVEKIHNRTPGVDSGMVVSGGARFSKNGKYIFFNVKQVSVQLPKPDPNAVQVDVWSYKDLLLQEEQLLEYKTKMVAFGLREEFRAVAFISNNKVLCLEQPNVENTSREGVDEYMILGHKKYVGDKFWLNENMKYEVISLNDKSKIQFAEGRCSEFAFNPEGGYLVFYDWKDHHYYGYNILTQNKTNISFNIQDVMFIDDKETKYNVTAPIGIKGWLSNTELLIYDNYDIWQVDITGEKSPINITNGYGMKNHLKFRLLEEKRLDDGNIYLKNEPLILTAFNELTKENGFFRAYPNKAKNPDQLSMQPYLYYVTNFQTQNGLLVLKPVKAKDADLWIVRRQSATDAPNFFLTRDFRSFTQLTNIQPQKKYNWLTTELHTWKKFDGEACQGILYKPENFDSTKKYPVIVNYYQMHSDEIHQFSRPEFIHTDLNVPWFVSRGYLVFVPDIHYTIGKTGESVVNSVVSGIKELSQFPFVDSTKIGIQGHSFGGYETNYLVTHTNCFAAAVEGAGASDFVSYYGSFLPVEMNFTLIPHFEPRGQYRLQANPWTDQEAYIKNSPIFNADKVNTPLLMMHNKNDMQVPWSQGVELFIALRRLDKPVWMLQYDQGAHGPLTEKDGIDYTNRMTQLFDHYLKDAPAPIWMTQGIPARLKGIETGYEFDPSGNCGKDCKICKMWNEKMKKDSVGTLKEIEEKTKTEHWMSSGNK